MNTILFACIHSAGRSQMAAGLFNSLADPAKAHALAAGTQPADRVHPAVVGAMREVGIDLSTAKPQLLTWVRLLCGGETWSEIAYLTLRSRVLRGGSGSGVFPSS